MKSQFGDRVKPTAKRYGLGERKMWELVKRGYPVLKIDGATIFDWERGDQWMRSHFSVEPPKAPHSTIEKKAAAIIRKMQK